LDSPFGIRVVQQRSADAEGYRAEAHFGQLLMVLGEADVPSDTQVTTASGHVGVVNDLYQDAVLRYSPDGELEFIACALAYWHPPQTTWLDQFGDEHNFDELLRRLISRPLGAGSCGGTHVPYAVVAILRVDDQYQIISSAMRQAARTWLITLGQLLEQRWSEAGGWDSKWASGVEKTLMWGDDILDRITVTGHHLEWMALAPVDCRPSRIAIKRAAGALLSDIESLPPLRRRSFKTLLPASHAARALALLRCEDPFVVWSRYWKAGKLKFTRDGYSVRSARATNFF
jgi:hypothetical protein